MAFSLYFVGFLVFIAGLASLSTALGVSASLVTGAALALLVAGFLGGLLHHRAREQRAPV